MSTLNLTGEQPVLRDVFRTTHWSMVLKAGLTGAGECETALSDLCKTYWYPLYAFIRRQGSSHHDAEDLTQQFFEHLLDKKILKHVDQQKGKFRSFLLASVKNFLSNDRDRKLTEKRGGKFSFISLDDEEAIEKRYLLEPSHNSTPERLFEQSWALTVIQTVMEQLKKEYITSGKGDFFEAGQQYLIGGEKAEGYASLAAKLNMREGAMKMAVLRMHRHFGYLLRAEIAQTVNDPTEIDEELRHLLVALNH